MAVLFETRSEPAGERDPGTAAPSCTAARFEIRFTRYVDPDGHFVAPPPAFAEDPAALAALYRGCKLTRAFDAAAVTLQRTGRLGTFPSSLGQEGTTVALGLAMHAEDVLLPTYRETGTMLVRGMRMTDLLLYWGGDERGMAYTRPKHDFPICVPVATHAPQAIGVAYALKYRGEPGAVVCPLGDGATSKGDFYEALNGAGVWQLPVVFVIVNNGWAISTPRNRQSAAQTLAQKAIAAGVPGEQVDGNDAIAVQHVVGNALRKARAGGGPHVVEALTYRLADHTTADDARRYRDADEVAMQQALDPVERLRKLLWSRGGWSRADDDALEAECRAAVEQAVAEYLATPPQPPASMFDHLFETLPASLEAQREELASGANDAREAHDAREGHDG